MTQILGQPCGFQVAAAAELAASNGGEASKRASAAGAAGAADACHLRAATTPGLPADATVRAAVARGRDADPGRGQGGRPAPFASRLHRIPTRFQLNLHGV